MAPRRRHRARAGRHLDRWISDGPVQHACRPAQQRVTGLGLRQAISLLGDDELRLVVGGARRRGAGHRRSERIFDLGNRYFRLLPQRLVERILPRRVRVPTRPRGSGVSTTSRPTPPPRPAPAMLPRCRSAATRAIRPRRCCSARAVWPWRSTAIDSPICGACSRPRRRWAMRCWRVFPPRGVTVGTSGLS